MKWPRKEERESLEVEGFIESYSRLPHGRKLVVLSRGECPDYLLVDQDSEEMFGVELTSVYLDDRSVPDKHMSEQEGAVFIEDNPLALEKYKERLVDKVSEKIAKAEKYSKTFPLILSVYVNEYISIYLTPEEMDQMVSKHRMIFDKIAPFSEVVFWSSPNDSVYSVK